MSAIFNAVGTQNDERYTPLETMATLVDCLGSRFNFDLATAPHVLDYLKDYFQPHTKYFSFNRPANFTDFLDLAPQNCLFYCNPPYSQNKYFGTLLQRITLSQLCSGFVLTNANTEQHWFRQYAKHSRFIWFPEKRIQFLGPDLKPLRNAAGQKSSNPRPQAIFGYGVDPSTAMLNTGLVVETVY